MDGPGCFEMQVMSDQGYEELIAEISFNGEFCLLISQEEGFESLRVVVHPRPDGKPWNLPVKELEEVLAKATARLWNMRRVVE